MRRSLHRPFSAALFAAIFALSLSAARAEFGGTVKVEGGEISGAVIGADPAIHVYKGIPFAAPPVGDLRWKAPAPVVPWEGVKACVEFGAGCSQPAPPIPVPGLSPAKKSEDCLYLNVWTPAKGEKDKLPVMVWIHGGGFAMGTAGVDMYDGAALVKQGVVLVTINYRLGPFGFMAHPALTKESKHGSSGNYGLLDQVAALEWVKENIAKFGGDPKRVTIFGESAGGVSVSMLMLTPLSKGLFQRAIAESGAASLLPPRHLTRPRLNMESAEAQGEALAKSLGCDTEADPISAMRAKSAEQILALGPKTEVAGDALFNGRAFPFWPIIDGWVIPEDPGKMFEQGKQHDVAFMMGTNADEGAMFLMLLPVRDMAAYEGLVRGNFGKSAEEAMKIYPCADATQIKDRLNEILTDSLFIAPTRHMAQGMMKKKAPAFVYHFTKKHATGFGASMGAHHAAEIPYVFGGLTAMKIDDAADHELSKKMMVYWSKFAANGDPNAEGLPKWERYDAAKDNYLELGETVEAKAALRKERLDFIQRHVAGMESEGAGAVGN